MPDSGFPLGRAILVGGGLGEKVGKATPISILSNLAGPALKVIFGVIMRIEFNKRGYIVIEWGES